jgi:hypothetical protein
MKYETPSLSLVASAAELILDGGLGMIDNPIEWTRELLVTGRE